MMNSNAFILDFWPLDNEIPPHCMHHQSWKLCGEWWGMLSTCPVRSYNLIFIIDNPWMLAIASFKVFLFHIWKRYESETISTPIHNFGPIYSKIAQWRVPYVSNWWRNREILTMEPVSTCLDESINTVKSIGWFSLHKSRSREHEFRVPSGTVWEKNLLQKPHWFESWVAHKTQAQHKAKAPFWDSIWSEIKWGIQAMVVNNSEYSSVTARILHRHAILICCNNVRAYQLLKWAITWYPRDM